MEDRNEVNMHNPMMRKVGRPFRYEDKDAHIFEQNIIDYFDSIMTTPEDFKLSGNVFKINPTITGMMLFIGLSTKQSYYDYMKREPFKDAAERAKLAIESVYESMLYEKGSAGAIFALKNFGWEDRNTIEFGGEIERVEINFTKPESETP